MQAKACLYACLLWVCGCGPTGPVVDEESDPSYERGRSYLKVGRESEALDEFLSVTRRVRQAPKSHLEVGRLLLQPSQRKDPVASIYHFRRFLLLQPDARESPMVEQWIRSAEHEIIRKLPGKPYENYLHSIDLEAENERLRREVADLKARLGSPLATAATTTEEETPSASIHSIDPVSNAEDPPIASTYVVQAGDSLYSISKKVYGNASYVDAIYSLNRHILKSKNSLKVGQTLNLPPRS